MTNITPEEVKQRLDKGETLNLIDVREPYENAEFNIRGKLIQLGKIQSMQIEDIEDLHVKELIFY
jgi:rhodanese-related sulfurtransferase